MYNCVLVNVFDQEDSLIYKGIYLGAWPLEFQFTYIIFWNKYEVQENSDSTVKISDFRVDWHYIVVTTNCI